MELSMQTTKRKKKREINRRMLSLYSMCVIPMALLFVFSYLPMVGIIIAFKDYKYSQGVFGSKWVGLENFKFFLRSNDFVEITWNTLYMNFLFIIFGIIAALAVAILFYYIHSRKVVKTFQTIFITPHFLSYVVVGYMVYAILQPQYGVMNSLLTKVGISPVDWYSAPKAWPAILLIASVWKNVGMDSVIYYAALMGIDSTLFDAAAVDGAGDWKIIKHIILPCLIPIVSIMTILKIGGIFRADFGLFYQLTRDSGALYSTTDVIDTYVFRMMRQMGEMGISSAIGLLQSIVGLVMVLITNKVSKLIDSENGLF